MILFGAKGGGQRVRLVDPSKLKKREDTAPKELKERQESGAREFYNVMEYFMKTDMKYPIKETIVMDQVKKGAFATSPPERWGDMAKMLYLATTAMCN